MYFYVLEIIFKITNIFNIKNNPKYYFKKYKNIINFL